MAIIECFELQLMFVNHLQSTLCLGTEHLFFLQKNHSVTASLFKFI